MGSALTMTTITVLVSHAVGPAEQGRVQGGNQAIQALGRVVGPAWAGWIYVFGSSVPFLSGMVCVLAAAGAVTLAIPGLAARTAHLESAHAPEQAAR
jgi:MFS family permease